MDRKQREKIEALKKNWDNTKSEGASTERKPTKKLMRNVRNVRNREKTRTQRNKTY